MKKFLAVMIAFMIATCGTVGAASELVSINCVTLSVKEAGHGEPMILLHGKGYSKEYMDSLFNYYAERYHVFSYDSRGHGKSDKPEAFTLEDDADDLVGLICKRANDILAEKVEAYPERFAAFATLPMADSEAAAAELERCVKELNFCGALLAGQFKGHFYEEERFFPIFEKAAELDVPVSFHPAPINPAVQDYYYTSPEYSPFVAGQFASAGFGWHVDAGIHEVRLILSGIFDKLPNLKIIAGHWGEAIPSYLERLDYMLPPQTTGLRKKVSDYYKENFYVTPSGILSSMQFEYIVKLMGADHILWAVDYPYIREGDFYGFLKNAEFLTQEQKELIAHKNAERILHIKGEF